LIAAPGPALNAGKKFQPRSARSRTNLPVAARRTGTPTQLRRHRRPKNRPVRVSPKAPAETAPVEPRPRNLARAQPEEQEQGRQHERPAHCQGGPIFTLVLNSTMFNGKNLHLQYRRHGEIVLARAQTSARPTAPAHARQAARATGISAASRSFSVRIPVGPARLAARQTRINSQRNRPKHQRQNPHRPPNE